MPGQRRRAPTRTKKSKSRKRPAANKDEWYTIRRILDERVVKGCVEYLVDWDDNAVTGEAYTPTWSREVTTAAREEWEQREAKSATPDPQSPVASVEGSDNGQPSRPVSHDQQPQAASAAAAADDNNDNDSDSSQPPRPANWRQLISRANKASRRRRSDSCSSTLSLGRPRKIPRIDTDGPRSEEPAPSFVSEPTVDTSSEIPEPFDEEDTAALTRAASVVVELPKNLDFDPDDYLSVIPSQNSGNSSQSLADLENEDSKVAVPSKFSQRTVPDSQEISDNSWSQHQVAEKPTSPAAPVEKPLPTSQSSSIPPVVAPDSLEQPQQQTSQSSEKTTSTQGGPSLFCLGSPSQMRAREDIAQQSETVDSDIPSRQPDYASAVADAESTELPESVSHQPSAASPVLGSASSPTPGAPKQTQAEPDFSPLYLSQPPPPIEFNLPESSVSNQAHQSQSSHPTATEATPSNNDSSGAPAREEESPAQRIRRSIDQGARQVRAAIESLERLESSNFDIAREIASAPVASQRSTVSEARSNQPEPEENRRKSVAEPPSSSRSSTPGRSWSMEEGDTSRRTSVREVREELYALLGWSDELPAQAPSSSDNGQVASADEASGNASGIESQEETSEKQPESPAQQQTSASPADRELTMEERLDIWTRHVAGTATEEEIALLEPKTPEERQRREEVVAELNAHIEAVTKADAEKYTRPETVSLADLTRQPNPDLSWQDPLSSGAAQDARLMEHIITVPFQASLRPEYNSIIMQYKDPIKKFSEIFSSEEYSAPDESLVKKIDDLFRDLFKLCDYPRDMIGGPVEWFPSDRQARYCCDVNPKFSFIYEFLQGVKRKTDVLIIASSREMISLLANICNALGLEWNGDTILVRHHRVTRPGIRVFLDLPNGPADPFAFDVVIAYDSSFHNSRMSRLLSARSPDLKQQLLLRLVTTHSIEHIDLHVPDKLTPIERSSMLLSATVRARKLVVDPDRGYSEPHELAADVFDFVNGDMDAIQCEEVPIPDDVLDVYLGSQSQSRSQMPREASEGPENDRKRKLVNEDDFDDSHSKRIRILSKNKAAIPDSEFPLPDDVRALLDAVAPKEQSEARAKVSLSVLQALAEKVSEYERQIEAANRDAEYQGVISGLEKRIKEHERTEKQSYESQRAALMDRSLFETEKRKVENAMKTASEQAEKDAEKARKRIAELVAAVARLTTDAKTSGPDDTPLAKTEKLLQEAQAKVGVLEKRLSNAHNDAEYARSLYQDASSSASAMKTENNQLKTQNEELRRKASESLVRVHQIQEQSTVKIYLGQISELKAQVRDREMELDRARDELRQLRNGRRETRQVSVPRSPRMGVMSPRTGRGGYGGGSASRGTSPASGAGVDGMPFGGGQQPRNGRWNHLQG